MIKNGQAINFRYQLFTEDGIEVASNLTDKDAQKIFIGRGQLMPALEEALKTMQPGDRQEIRLEAEEAFGAAKPEFVKQTRLSKIPEKQRTVGNILDMEDSTGNICSARIHAIDKNNVILDFNHPLAGQAVIFHIELVSIDE